MKPSQEDFDDIKYLLSESDYHFDWEEQELNDYVRVPLELGQFFVIRDEGRLPLSFATWAYPSADHVVKYLEEKKFMKEGYDGGGLEPWLIDFIAIGGKRNIAFAFRKLKSVLSMRGHNSAYWFRTETNKLGFHKWQV
tara:strand:+ start:305 stop:718 length:414 start_codon:yes stop_codon:yes gene_type:complete